MIYTHEGYPKCIVETLKNLAAQQKKLYDLRQVAQDCENIADEFNKVDGISMTVSMWVDYWNTVYVGVTVDTMEQVADILRAFAKCGCTQERDLTESPEDNKREYFLKSVRLEVQLSGLVCRYVKVGEETIVKDILELRCDEPKTEDVAA